MTPQQRSVLLGSLLGDGILLRTTSGWCFRAHHGIKQLAYVEWKYRILAPFVRTPPRSYGGRCYFRTITHPELNCLRRQFYPNGRKVVPLRFLESQLNSLALAVWIMDDGSADGNAVRLNTQSFTRLENEMLMLLLSAKFGLHATLNKDKNAFRIRISAHHAKSLRERIGDLVLPELRYKIGL